MILSKLLMVYSEGRTAQVTPAALQALAYGHRIAFIEVFCGMMRLTLAVRAAGLRAPDGLDRCLPLGDRQWNFEL